MLCGHLGWRLGTFWHIVLFVQAELLLSGEQRGVSVVVETDCWHWLLEKELQQSQLCLLPHIYTYDHSVLIIISTDEFWLQLFI